MLPIIFQMFKVKRQNHLLEIVETLKTYLTFVKSLCSTHSLRINCSFSY